VKKEVIHTQDDIVTTIEQYSNTIYKVAFSYTRDRTVAEDILQNVFLKYMTASIEYHGEEHKKAWLLRVTINECKKSYFSLWNLRKIPLEDVYSFQEPEKHAVFFAVMDLPVRYRLIIHLFYYEELSVKEIGQVLHLNENTIMSRLYRGRKLLKDILEVEYEYRTI
jgi:RNA polymerase sigma-70 factor (ECF subfamily)